MTGPPAHVAKRARSVQLVVLDVDGVLTDGTLYYSAEGEVLKTFHVRDGLGIRLLQHAGIPVAVISARESPALRRRLDELAIEPALIGTSNKEQALDELLASTDTAASDVACVVDDVLDLPLLRRVGLPIVVRDAHPLARHEAAWVTDAPGGEGAVREVADGLLQARGQLLETVSSVASPNQAG